MYSLKFSRTKKFFVDFVVFGAPTKFLSMKISHLAVVICENFITKWANSANHKIFVLENFRLYIYTCMITCTVAL